MTATIDATQTVTTTPATAQASVPSHGKGSFTFHDLWETVNPLQHLPLIGPIYREITGDTITPAARIAGDSLYGGMFGAIGGIVDSLVEGETGKDIGGHIMATVFGDDDGDAKTVAASAVPQDGVQTASAQASQSGAPTSLLPPDLSGLASPVPAATAAHAAMSTPATAPQAGPTSFYANLQKGGHSSHGKPLTTSVPLPDAAKPLVNIPGAPKPATDPQSPAQAAAPGAKPAFVNPLTDSTNNMSDMSGLTSSAINPALASGSASGMPAQMMKALDQYAKLQKQQTATAIGQTDMVVN